MKTDNNILTIQNKIVTIRNVQVLLDVDLDLLYGVETKVLNQAVKRNIDRFPDAFRFQLSEQEYDNCSRSQFVTLNSYQKIKRGANTKYRPFAYTEQGISMLSAVLRSKVAIQTSIQIINTFVEMRRFLMNHAGIFDRIESLKHK